jgi:hypothetical protein
MSRSSHLSSRQPGSLLNESLVNESLVVVIVIAIIASVAIPLS